MAKDIKEDKKDMQFPELRKAMRDAFWARYGITMNASEIIVPESSDCLHQPPKVN